MDGGAPSSDSRGLCRRAAMSLHQQVADSLARSLESMSSGDQLPTEAELMHQFGVSRTTIRTAVSALVEQGLLVRRQGKGTFVCAPGVRHSLDYLSPFFAVLSAAGQTPETEIVQFGWATGLVVPPQLGRPEARVLSYRRLYRAEGRPHALLHVRVAEIFGRGIERADVEDTPIFHVLERKHDLILRRARYSIRSTNADAEVAHELRLPVGEPLLVMNRLTSTASGEPVEYTTHYLRSDVYELTVNLDEQSSMQTTSSPWSLTHTNSHSSSMQ